LSLPFILLPSASANNGFLKMVSLDARSEELQAAFGAVLGCSSGSAADDQAQRTTGVRKDLQVVWQSLPKNEYGRVAWPLIRYMAHRHFMQRFNILVRGLEPTIQVNASHGGEAEILSQQAPGLAKLSTEIAARGFSMDDASTMIVALEQLLFASDGVVLEKIYKAKNLDIHSSVTRQTLVSLMGDYMVYWMLGDDQETAEELLKHQELLEDSIPFWSDIIGHVDGSLQAFEFERQQRPRPGRGRAVFEGQFSFDDAVEVAGDIGRGFGAFWEPQCMDTKSSLMANEMYDTGRVRLKDFYGANKDGEWRFGESEAYLRELGSLDESSSRGKQVIVSNYIQAASNCIVTRPHYLVCCRAECEDILREVEVAVGGPLATVDQILQIVTSMTDGSDDNVRVAVALRNQLHSVASTHNGQVPLHGRLFAQWLHYVFPHECVFPHKSGAVVVVTPGQFAGEALVSEEEMHKQAADDVVQQDLSGFAHNDSVQRLQWMTQWSEEEELLGDYGRHLSGPGMARPLLAAGGVVAIVLGFVWAGTTSKASVKADNVFCGKAHFV